MKWFKLFGEARNDAKLRALSPEQFRVWFNLMCFASEKDESGVIANYSDLLLAAEVSNGDEALLCGTLERLAELRIIVTEGDPSNRTVKFLHYARRQARPGEDKEAAAARVRRYRAAQKLLTQIEDEALESPEENRGDGTSGYEQGTSVPSYEVPCCNAEKETEVEVEGDINKTHSRARS